MKIQELKIILLFMLLLAFIVASYRTNDVLHKHLFSAMTVIIGAYAINQLSNPKQIKNE